MGGQRIARCVLLQSLWLAAVRARDVELTELPGIGQNILFVAQALFYGLSNAVSRHTTTWQHPYGENVVLTAQVLVVVASLAQFVLIHYPPLARSGGEWLLALHLALPSPLLVPVSCFITYRQFGLLNRKAMRPETADWESMRGDRVPYLKLSQNSVGLVVNLISLVVTFYSLWVLAARTGGAMYPLFSALVVLLLTGPLGAVPALPDSKRPCQLPRGNTVRGDQLLIPVFTDSDETSVIVISMPAWSSNLHITRLSTNLEYTPFKRSNYKEAFTRLLSRPPDASDTEQFVDDFKATFQLLTEMFSREGEMQFPSERFAQALAARKDRILNDLKVFDGNSSKLRALAMVIINIVLNKSQERGVKVDRMVYPDLKGVADLFAWSYKKDHDALPPLIEVKTGGVNVPPRPPAAANYTYSEWPSGEHSGQPQGQHSGQPQDVQVSYELAQGGGGAPGVVLKDASGGVYRLSELDEMVEQLSKGERHEVMFYLLLEKMAQNNDSRLVQQDTLAGGADVTLFVGQTSVEARFWSGSAERAAQEEKARGGDLEERRKRDGFESIKSDSTYTSHSPDAGIVHQRASPQSVPVAWNAFWIIQQHVLAWLLTYMGGSVVVILFDTFLRNATLESAA